MNKMLIRVIAAAIICVVCTACGAKENNESSDMALSETADNSEGNAAKKPETSAGEMIDLSAVGDSYKIERGGTYTLTGELSGHVEIDCDDEVMLVLNGVSITGDDMPAIYAPNVKKLTVELAEGSDNVLTDGKTRTDEKIDSCIFSKSDIILQGSGKLKINGAYEHGIVSKDGLTVDGNVTFDINAVSDCIQANERIEINGGFFTLSSGGDECIQSETEICINGGEIVCASAGDCIKAEQLVEINGGKVTVTNANEAIESKDRLIINGGKIDVKSSDDCINSANTIIINGGRLQAVSTGNDAVDSNGTIEINGGTVIAIGSGAPECGIDSDDRGFTLNGGEVISVGGAYSAPNDGTQSFIAVSSESMTGYKLIEVKNASGEIVYSIELPEYSLSMGGLGRENRGGDLKNPFENGEMPQPEQVSGEQGEMPQRPQMSGEQAEMPNNDAAPSERPQREDKMHGGIGGFGGGRGEMSNGQNIMISVPSLQEGETYTIYGDGVEIGKGEIK